MMQLREEALVNESNGSVLPLSRTSVVPLIPTDFFSVNDN